jgi:hypothetical protein
MKNIIKSLLIIISMLAFSYLVNVLAVFLIGKLYVLIFGSGFPLSCWIMGFISWMILATLSTIKSLMGSKKQK